MKIYYEGQKETGFDIFGKVCPICGGKVEVEMSYKRGYGKHDIFTCEDCNFTAVTNKILAQFLVDCGDFDGTIEL